MATKSTVKKKGRKRPAHILRLLPYPDFPLSPHVASGRWYKVIRGKRHYFGPLDTWEAALGTYQNQRDDLYAGRPPRADTGGLEVAQLVNAYLDAAHRRLKAGEIKPATFDAYKANGGRIVAAFGRARLVDDLGPVDFGMLRSAFASVFGPSELSKQIQLTRSVFKYGYDSELMDKPKRFGSEFKKPSRMVQRKHRRSKPRRMFEADDLRRIIQAANVPLKAMVLLGINCGWGNSDIAELTLTALDLDRAYTDFPRPKTEIEREAVLWPETVAALRDAIKARPDPKADADAGLVFVTKYGRRFVRYRAARGDGKGGAWTDGVRLQFNKLLKSLDLHEPGVSFYALRHGFQTVAEGAGDLPAVTRIMGHADESMAERYRERIDVERLQAVADHVHAWLWPGKGANVAEG